MPSQITLTITKGKLKGQQFIFDKRTTCIMGRGPKCYPQLPNDEDHSTISRFHCLLDINPPDIRIRDFGSKHGTYVNGKKIGQRERNQNASGAVKSEFPEYDLQSGDEIRLGNTVFTVGIKVNEKVESLNVVIPNPKSQAENLESVKMDYTRLRDLLAKGEWRKADEETRRVMLAVAGREEAGWLDGGSIDNFPCEDLRIIDQLWIKYSNGRFGFSMQKRIYASLAEQLGEYYVTEEYNWVLTWEFFDRVGWISRDDEGGDEFVKCDLLLDFDLEAPEGHLPYAPLCDPNPDRGSDWIVTAPDSRHSSLVSRLENCNI